MDNPLVTRLRSIATLTQSEIESLSLKETDFRHVRKDARLFSRTGANVPLMLFSGWAARMRFVPSGKRLGLTVMLPGDIIRPVNEVNFPVIALTPLSVADAPAPTRGSTLEQAYEVVRQQDESYQLSHVSRLASLGATDRLIDFVGEIYGRLSRVNLTARQGFEIPFSQVVVGDLLGITSVHTNRTIRDTRLAGDLEWSRGAVRLLPDGRLGKHLASDQA